MAFKLKNIRCCYFHLETSVVIIFGIISCCTSGFSEFRFSLEPKDTTVIRDDATLLNCSVVGQAAVLRWKKDGLLLDLINDGDRRVVLPNGSLYFKKVLHSRTERPDEGLYQCTATMEGTGTIMSREARLQIASLPPFEKGPQNVSVFLDQAVYFPCAIHAIPKATITWFKNEHPLRLDETRMSILPSGSLEVDAVMPNDEGSYHCVATNAEKSRKSDIGTLFVNKDYDQSTNPAPPHFIATPPEALLALKSSNLTIDCAANGFPKPRITWLKDGSTIDFADLDSRFRIVGSGSLSIERITEYDAGSYMCRAENIEDSVDASTMLDVLVSPQFTSKLSNKYARETEDVTFKCEVQGNPVPSIQWFKNGDIIYSSEYFQITNANTLKILGAIKSDAGIYQCFATNSVGSTQMSAQLQVLDSNSTVPSTLSPVPSPPDTIGQLQYSPKSPSQPLNLTAIIVNTRFVTLSWEQPLQKNGNILGYTVYYKEMDSLRERQKNVTKPDLEDINIQELHPDTDYTFRVMAFNQYGPGQLSEKLVIKTLPEVHVPDSPDALYIFPIDSTSVKASWSAPNISSEPIDHYRLRYYETGTQDEHEIMTTDTSYTVRGLKKFTEYTFGVIAFNKNGPGTSTEEITIHTYADKPSATPQNVTLEPDSSSSIIIRWEPPPKDFQNGKITGYKIRFKRKNGNSEQFTTDSNRRYYTLSDLEKGAQYMVKIAALSVNGSGPFTDWKTVETYPNDLIVSKVPDRPSSLRGRPASNSILVSWGPPRDQTIIVRGYKVGWGINIPDVYSKTLDGKQRHFTIEDLQPSSEYVISLKAFNEVGDGIPVYETVKTHIEPTPEPFIPMVPPVGLKAIVLSSSTVVLYWTDTSLSRNQVITDNRYYTVRYTTYSYTASPKYRYFNSTELNCMIDDLKPNTQFEFSVKVVKGKKDSMWSMTVLNTTQEAAPSSPPRDLTIVASESDNLQLNLHWQPPKQPNGHITGYVIFYTTDKTQKDRDWLVEAVIGDKMTAILKGLNSNSAYYFKIQARNNKGYGPLSSEIVFNTGAGFALTTGTSLFGEKGLSNNMVVYIVIACVSGLTLFIVIGVSIVVCRKKNGYLAAEGSKSYKANLSKSKSAQKDLVPPDLWIHHDQMELKTLDKSNGSSLSTNSLQKSSQDLGHEPLLNTLEKKKSAYMVSSESMHANLLSNSEKCIVKPRPIRATPIISLEHQKSVANEVSLSSTSCNFNQNSYDNSTASLGRPMYPRTQYNIHRNPSAHEGHQNTVPLCDPPPPPSISIMPRCSANSAYDISSKPITSPETHSVTFIPTLHENPTGSTNTLSKKQSCAQQHPMRSFVVPPTAPSSVPATPLSKHIALKSGPVVSNSPHKKVVLQVPGDPSTGSPKPLVSLHQALKNGSATSSSSSKSQDSEGASPDIQTSVSTEHLNKEVANLEGLMKDLNEITASEFKC